MSGQHTPGEDREFVRAVRSSLESPPISGDKYAERLLAIIDRLEAEKAELVEALRELHVKHGYFTVCNRCGTGTRELVKIKSGERKGKLLCKQCRKAERSE